MKRITYFALAACFMLAITCWYSLHNNATSSQVAIRADIDLERLNYTIGGSPVRFGSGIHHSEDGDVSVVASDTGDLDGDDDDDLVVVLRLDGAGSGIFYYINAFLYDGQGQWVNAGEAFLGDRIQFEFLDVYEDESVSALTGVAIHPADYGQFVVGYRLHSQGQAFTEKPNLFFTKHWQVANGRLVLIEDF